MPAAKLFNIADSRKWISNDRQHRLKPKRIFASVTCRWTRLNGVMQEVGMPHFESFPSDPTTQSLSKARQTWFRCVGSTDSSDSRQPRNGPFFQYVSTQRTNFCRIIYSLLPMTASTSFLITVPTLDLYLSKKILHLTRVLFKCHASIVNFCLSCRTRVLLMKFV